MGLSKKPSGSIDWAKAATQIQPPNPDPRNYSVVWWEQVGRGLIVEIYYPGCTTYEGKKVLVFAHTSIKALLFGPAIDPHFSDAMPEGAFSPIARFRPSKEGWRLARICAAAIEDRPGSANGKNADEQLGTDTR